MLEFGSTPTIMTAMRAATGNPRLSRAARAALRAALAALALLAGALAAGCGTAHPGPISATELAEAETFPYFRVYWVGRSFLGHPLAAADGLNSYLSNVGDSVYYGDCVQSKGIFGGGSCELPLQVTTVIYHRHLNAALGPQRNMVIRGVPAVVSTKAARSSCTAAASRSTSSPTATRMRSPNGCCR